MAELRSDRAESERWIDRLASEIREKNREAAQAFGREQHFAAVVERLGAAFFLKLTTQLEQDIDALRRRLQGDITSAEMAVQSPRAGELRITRERFPWVDATITHRGDTILVDYARSEGVGGDPMLDRKSHASTLRAGGDDRLYAENSFAEQPDRFDTPEELARAILELLFGF